MNVPDLAGLQLDRGMTLCHASHLPGWGSSVMGRCGRHMLISVSLTYRFLCAISALSLVTTSTGGAAVQKLSIIE